METALTIVARLQTDLAADGLSLIGLNLLLLILFAAGLVSGISGFAFSAVAACILWILPPLTAIPLLMMLSVSNQLLSLAALRRDIRLLPSSDAEGTLPYIFGGLVGVPIGIAVLRHLPSGGVAAVLGAFLVGYSAFMLWRSQTPSVLGVNWRAAVMIGALGGVVGGFSAFPGSMPVVWLSLRGRGKEEMRGVVQPYILTLQIFALALLTLRGTLRIDESALLLFALAMPVVLMGTAAGVALYRRLSDLNFRRAVLLFLAVSGLALVGKAWG
jgi:hypothetical protein